MNDQQVPSTVEPENDAVVDAPRSSGLPQSTSDQRIDTLPIHPAIFNNFRIGERFPWKGFEFEVQHLAGMGMALMLVGRTKKSIKKGR